MAQDSIELRALNSGTSKDSPQENVLSNSSEPPVLNAESSLPPVDTGKQAWLFLSACWVVEAFTFGFGFSFGVFQNYYSTHEPFAGSGNIAVIGTTTSGLLYLGTPFVLVLCRLYPRWARWATVVGLFLASLSMAMASFCTSVPQLIGAQGFLFGIGGCIAYCPCTLYIDEWFARRKGMAYGIVWSAAGAGGLILPLLLEVLLARFGFKTAMRVWSGILFVSTAPLAYFIKPRLPYSARVYRTPFNMRFAISRRFLMHQLVNVIEATGYFLPSIFLPTYARVVFDSSTFLSTLTVMLVNISATVGLVVMGSLSDKLQVTSCMIMSASGVAIAVLLVWGLSASLPALYVFCVLYGLFAGSWSSIWPGIMKEIAQNGEADGYGLTDPVMVQGHLCIGRGLGNVLSGPLSSALTKGMPWKGQAIAGYGSGYGGLILYTGVTGLVSGMNFLWKALKLL
ncbi:major facilitator superfamily domain-containing protein [Xylariaceae sp. FL0016]|nr:major facilitator superfamily domain-containing protein [Xylariaceae sp. FL0016]